MNRRLLLVVTGWLTVGLIATGAGLTLTTALGDAITRSGNRALSPDDVRRALDDTPAPSPSQTPTETASSSAVPSRKPSPPASAPARAVTVPGGIVVARCADGLVTLESWTPAPGYQVDDIERGPRDVVRVKFESEEGHGAKAESEVRCSGGRPVATVKESRTR
ncbi:hypothetical protein Pth03_81010 [Planotetraspora thailandica]|uniref:Septum formation initiator n=1 Tax=Planotetraspora thailandica TaxID=487172 RepID=A0A8J3Y2W6_9ACTN|nr:hypothetical protein [Planotetraspora thailandica]GII59712.1 hypothetical protein Pth03_81010 [Planotetraspora thailandica]